MWLDKKNNWIIIVLINQIHHRSAIALSVVCILVAFFITAAAYQITAHADSVSWVAGGELKLLDNSERSMSLQPQHCREQKILINDRPGLNYYDEKGFTNACVYSMGQWRYALTNRSYGGTYVSYRDVSFALSVGADSKMYRVSNLHPLDIPVHTANSKGLVYANGGIGWGRKLTIYKDVIKRLVKVDADTYMVSNVDSPDFTFKRPNGDLLSVGKVVSSENGKWLAFEAIDLGIIRLNLATHEMRRVSAVAPRYGLGDTPHMSLSISDDGSYLAIAGENTPFKIYHVTNDCGDAMITDEISKDIPLAKPCPERDLGQYLDAILPSGLAAAHTIKLSPDAGEIGFIARQNNDRTWQNQKEYVIQSPGYMPVARLEYLAMGDSYSSGEGDTQVVKGKKHYLLGTDVEGNDQIPREKCHISSRSFPFLLKDMMSLSDDRMKSVACSGAEVAKDFLHTNSYRGQSQNGAPRLEQLPQDDLKTYQSNAGVNFIPGRIQQLNFVSKYGPNVITFTGGGNDVGFGSVILNCLAGLATCDDAQSPEGRARIGQAIKEQYKDLYEMYRSIKLKSPHSKVFAIGYPQFIDDASSFCAPNVQLNNVERKLISEAVTFLNEVIKDAASDAGVKYIDIEDSLVGHRLCESGKSFVTGIAFVGKNERQESFHPNHEGHILIANAITKGLGGETLMEYADSQMTQGDSNNEYSVSTPLYFKSAMDAVSKRYKHEQIVERQYIQKKSSFGASVDGFYPKSHVKVEIHSNPIDLGVYEIDSEGRLATDIVVPDSISAGFHTLHIIGQTYSGEEIDIWQGIEVRGLEGDIDEDGIMDEVDACMYVSGFGTDIDGDQVDDGCDPIIDEAKIVDSYANLTKVQMISSVEMEGGGSSRVELAQTQDLESEGRVDDVFRIPTRVAVDNIATDSGVTRSLLVSLAMVLFCIVFYSTVKRYSRHNNS
jgi:lysophospholipase L1-like esterase